MNDVMSLVFFVGLLLGALAMNAVCNAQEDTEWQTETNVSRSAGDVEGEE